MWAHLWHLIWHSLAYMPGIISGNWISIFFPMGIFLAGEGFRLKKEGWRTLNLPGVRRDALLMVLAYSLLFAWAVVHTVYQDHMELTQQLREAINKNPVLEAHFDWVSDGELINSVTRRHRFSVYANINVLNRRGAPRSLSGWDMFLATKTGRIYGMPYEPSSGHVNDPALGMGMALPSAHLDRCPQKTEDPIQPGGDRSCWLIAVFDIPRAQIDEEHTVVVIKFVDVLTGRVYEYSHALPTRPFQREEPQ